MRLELYRKQTKSIPLQFYLSFSGTPSQVDRFVSPSTKLYCSQPSEMGVVPVSPEVMAASKKPSVNSVNWLP